CILKSDPRAVPGGAAHHPLQQKFSAAPPQPPALARWGCPPLRAHLTTITLDPHRNRPMLSCMDGEHAPRKMLRPAYWRARARAVRSEAERTIDPAMREAMMSTADRYDAVASENASRRAVELGSRGGKAKGASLSKERRTEIARIAAEIRWKSKR